MDHAAQSVARYRIYIMLSRLYLNGLTADLLPYVEEIPELASAAAQPFDADEAAAAHYGIFAHNIFPYESIFRDPSGLLGGKYSEQVNTTYKRASVQINADQDHIGHELAFLASLCNAESKALDNEEIEAARVIAKRQAVFLREHLLEWLSPFVTALSFSGQPFYEALGQLSQELIYDHLLTFAEEGSANSYGGPLEENDTEIGDILRDGKTGLKQIASFLITPPYSGFFIGHSTISQFARKRQLPRGFGNRQQMLSNLLHSAAQYDLISDLFQDLAEHAGAWAKCYERQIFDYPELETWIRPWLERIDNTARALSEMRSLSIAAL